jgi:hypothetical protein
MHDVLAEYDWENFNVTDYKNTVRYGEHATECAGFTVGSIIESVCSDFNFSAPYT